MKRATSAAVVDLERLRSVVRSTPDDEKRFELAWLLVELERAARAGLDPITVLVRDLRKMNLSLPPMAGLIELEEFCASNGISAGARLGAALDRRRVRKRPRPKAAGRRGPVASGRVGGVGALWPHVSLWLRMLRAARRTIGRSDSGRRQTLERALLAWRKHFIPWEADDDRESVCRGLAPDIDWALGSYANQPRSRRFTGPLAEPEDVVVERLKMLRSDASVKLLRRAEREWHRGQRRQGPPRSMI
jgi:hypothetical protein